MKRSVLTLGIVLGTAVALWAGGFWEKTKFPDWDAKQVEKMLSNSPWAHAVEVRMQGPPVAAAPRGGRRGGGSIPDASSGGGGWGDQGGAGGGPSRPGGDMDRMPSVPTVKLVVRCYSALPIRQAIAKGRFGDEVLTSSEAQKFLAPRETHYLIGVAGLDPRLLGKADAASLAALKDKALLKLKRKPPIQAEQVQAGMEPGGAILLMFFPRSGQEIEPEDGEIELLLKLPAFEVKRSFKLKDMVYEGKLEI